MNDIHDFTNKERQSLDKIKLECKDAFAFAEQSPYPPQETAYDHIYAGESSDEIFRSNFEGFKEKTLNR